MSYGGVFYKSSGEEAYSTGERLLRYHGRLELTIGAFSYVVGSIVRSSSDHETVQRRLAPYFIEVLTPDVLSHFGISSASDVIFFIRAPGQPGLKFSQSRSHLTTSRVQAAGFYLSGSGAGGVIEIYLFSVGNPTLHEASAGHGLSVFDALGAPIYSTNFPDLMLEGVYQFTINSAPFSVSGLRRINISHSMLSTHTAFFASGGCVAKVDIPGGYGFGFVMGAGYNTSGNTLIIDMFRAERGLNYDYTAGGPWYTDRMLTQSGALTGVLMAIDTRKYNPITKRTMRKSATLYRPAVEPGF